MIAHAKPAKQLNKDQHHSSTIVPGPRLILILNPICKLRFSKKKSQIRLQNGDHLHTVCHPLTAVILQTVKSIGIKGYTKKTLPLLPGHCSPRKQTGAYYLSHDNSWQRFWYQSIKKAEPQPRQIKTKIEKGTSRTNTEKYKTYGRKKIQIPKSLIPYVPNHPHMSHTINVQTGHLVPQRTQPRKWRTIANALDPPQTKKKTPYMVIGPTGIENLSEISANNIFTEQSTNEIYPNNNYEVKGGLGDILKDLFTPPGSPKYPNLNFPSSDPAAQFMSPELRAKNELSEYINTVDDHTAEQLRKLNWELLGHPRPTGPTPIYKEPPMADLESDQKLRKHLFQGHTFEVSIDLTQEDDVEEVKVQDLSQYEILNQFSNNLEGDMIEALDAGTSEFFDID